MSDVTVIGLGAMGSALARTVLQAGYSVTVWNRSSDKIKPLVDIGASKGEVDPVFWTAPLGVILHDISPPPAA